METTKKDLTQVINILSNVVNKLGNSDKESAEVLLGEFQKTHRTLQQGIIRLLAEFIQKVGETDPIWTDLRNEAAIEWCKNVSKTDAILPLI